MYRIFVRRYKNTSIKMILDEDLRVKLLCEKFLEMSEAEYNKLQRDACCEEVEEALASNSDEWEKLPNGKWRAKPTVLDAEFIGEIK